ncbi:lipopolysaccharide biosynthesis protein [Altererythrobacter sp. H2]|uniref:lipopolysaccharide biosynthesis protein n=1 Tax=Altererythrobacter sp. H2 TaxID=3108391 RepID=UPI002B4BACB9|nr:lipopolysaccharide biosynthesis protein [Altererythrobacter sp. H2]WRK94750.1 lipopolysaccharide biosynthesis protein [Altererythrobacter sp. H2]
MATTDTTDMSRKVRSAVIWRSGSQIVAQAIAWLSTFLVIRLLAPEDYGLFAMTQVMLVFLNTMNGYGIASALIREQDVSDHRLRQALGLLLMLNGALGAIQFLAAPLVASYFAQPMVADLLRVQAVMYLLTPWLALPHAMLSRKMDFRRPAQIRLLASLAGAGTALACALGGAGVWTLVAAPMALFLTEAVGMTIAARAPLRPNFDFTGLGGIAGFGGLMTATQFFWFVQSQADVIIAGRVLDVRSLGIYTTGLFLAQLLATKFVPPVNEVAYAAYARMQGAGGEALLATVRLVLLVALPAYAGMAVIADPLVLVLLGKQWTGIAAILPILSLAMAMLTLQILFAPATNALGKPGIALKVSMIGSVAMPLVFLAAIPFGLTGFAWAWVGGVAVMLAVTIALSVRTLGLSLRKLAGAVLPPGLAAGAMAAGVAAIAQVLPPMPAMGQLGLLIPLGAAFYGAVLWLIARDRLVEAYRFAVGTAAGSAAPASG